MLIPVEAASDTKEFCMIEFQGEIHHEEGLTKGFIAGALSSHAFKKDTLELQIGYHRLEGTRVPVKKPLLVLYKNASQDGETVFHTEDNVHHMAEISHYKRRGYSLTHDAPSITGPSTQQVADAPASNFLSPSDGQ